MKQPNENLEKNNGFDLDALMTERQAAKFLGFSPRFLQMRRLQGSGPKYIKVSARAVRYRRRDLIEWIESRTRTSTSDNPLA